MSKTAAGLIAYVKAQLGHPYWYGCFGQVSSKLLYSSKKAQYPQQYSWDCKDNQPGTSPAKQLGVRVYDCIGLIKGYLWSDSVGGPLTYQKTQDVSANGMLDKCTHKGTIGSIPDVPGLLVFLPGHVGVYIGGGKVIEAKGHKYGVVETALKGRGWTHWGYCPWITYEAESKPASNNTAAGNGSFANRVLWQNGKTNEFMYSDNNFKHKIAIIGAKAKHWCYSKAGNAWLIVSTYDGGKHATAGFVRYPGGLTKAPPESKTWKNGSTRETVYADVDKKIKVGSLNPYETAYCLAKIDGMYLVLYKVDNSTVQKCGFVSYHGGCN